MSETTLTSPSTITPLQAMLHELYSLLEQWKFPDPDGAGSYLGYTGGTYKFAIGSNRTTFGFNVDPSAWSSSVTAFDLGPLGALRSDTSLVEFAGNSYFDGTNFKAKATGLGGRALITAGTLSYLYAASVSAGSNQTFVEGWRYDAADSKFKVGTTSADPSGARTNGLAIDNAGGVNLRSPSGASVWGVSATSGTHVTWSTDNGSARVSAGSVSSSGSTTSYNTTSDRRLKTDVAPAGDVGAVVDSLQVVSFKWKAGGEPVRAGFIAQDLMSVAPEAVTPGGEDVEKEPWGVDYAKLVPLLVKEIQSLRARVAALEAP